MDCYFYYFKSNGSNIRDFSLQLLLIVLPELPAGYYDTPWHFLFRQMYTLKIAKCVCFSCRKLQFLPSELWLRQSVLASMCSYTVDIARRTYLHGAFESIRIFSDLHQTATSNAKSCQSWTVSFISVQYPRFYLD
ncbi:hypothetical protein Plhal304r1_c003g0013641 [Plasmopara halstedii]